MALGDDFFKEQYENLSVEELKKNLRSHTNIFYKLHCIIGDYKMRKKGIDDNSTVSDNETRIRVIKKLISEKTKEEK